MNRETHLLQGKVKQDLVSHTSPGYNAATGAQPTPQPQLKQELFHGHGERWPVQVMADPISHRASLVPAMPQQDPSSTPTNSEVSHCLPQVLQRPTFPVQTHLAQGELNFLDPPPQTRAKDSLSPVSNTKLSSPQAFYKGVVFAAHLLWTIIPTYWQKHTANSLLVTGYKKNSLELLITPTAKFSFVKNNKCNYREKRQNVFGHLESG